MNESKGVVPIRPSVPPKSIQETYRKHPITITFIPTTQQWRWSIKRTTTVMHEGYAGDINAARKDAHKLVDKMEDQ